MPNLFSRLSPSSNLSSSSLDSNQSSLLNTFSYEDTSIDSVDIIKSNLNGTTSNNFNSHSASLSSSTYHKCNNVIELQIQPIRSSSSTLLSSQSPSPPSSLISPTDELGSSLLLNSSNLDIIDDEINNSSSQIINSSSSFTSSQKFISSFLSGYSVFISWFSHRPGVPRPRLLGFFLLTLSAVIFSIMSLLVSLSAPYFPSSEIVAFRCFTQFTLAALTLKWKRIPIWGPKEKRGWLIARGTVGMLSFSCFYYALTVLSLADATVLFFTAPIWTGILGRLILKEKYNWLDGLASIATIIGVVFVARPAFLFGNNGGEDQNEGGGGEGGGETQSNTSSAATAFAVFVALGGAVFTAGVFICIRKVGPGVNPFVLVQYLGFMGLLFSPFTLLFQTWRWPPNFSIWMVEFAIGVCAFTGQFLFNAGTQLETALTASVIRNLDMVFAFILQLIVQRNVPSPWSFLGAFIVLTSVVGVALRKMLTKKSGIQSQQQLNGGKIGENENQEIISVGTAAPVSTSQENSLTSLRNEMELEHEVESEDGGVEIRGDGEAESDRYR